MLGGAQNPHVLNCTFRFLRAVRLVLHPKKVVFEKVHWHLAFCLN